MALEFLPAQSVLSLEFPTYKVVEPDEYRLLEPDVI